MRQVTHTPGPWIRNIRAEGKYPTVFAGRNIHVAVAQQMPTPAETEANIDLIAAAPELLEALKEARFWVFRECEDGFEPLVKIDAAIAKAEGRS